MSRDDVLIATKAGLRPGMERRRDGSRGHLLSTLDASLRRLGTDHVDIWQVHGYDPDTPLDETLSALDYAVTSGRVRYVGVSNFSGWQTAQAATWQSAWPGRAPIVSTQVEYSLLERGIEREVLPACEAFGLGVLPWSPLGRGRADRQVPQRPAGRLAGRVAAFRAVRRPVPRSALLGDRRVGADRGRRARRLPGARSRWPGSATGPASSAPVLGARTVGQLLGALQAEEITLPARDQPGARRRVRDRVRLPRAPGLSRPVERRSPVRRVASAQPLVRRLPGEQDNGMDYEYAPLRIPSNVDRATAAAQLTIAAEFSDWELARVRLLRDGTRQVMLRRRCDRWAEPAADAVDAR